MHKVAFCLTQFSLCFLGPKWLTYDLWHDSTPCSWHCPKQSQSPLYVNHDPLGWLIWTSKSFYPSGRELNVRIRQAGRSLAHPRTHSVPASDEQPGSDDVIRHWCAMPNLEDVRCPEGQNKRMCQNMVEIAIQNGTYLNMLNMLYNTITQHVKYVKNCWNCKAILHSVLKTLCQCVAQRPLMTWCFFQINSTDVKHAQASFHSAKGLWN